ncbi:MAG TPA: hypothetical protein VN328_10425, partial [Thermodesulfovibrionales bacterium]|nr:hypothetical protein [Thermodesulfovibrionales bacterium]
MHWKSLMRHMNVMNAALLAILILFAANKVPSFFNTQAKYTLPSPSKSAEMEEKTVETPPLSPSEYTAIADQNIFHPDRMIPAFKADAPPLPKPEFILYGTLVSSDISLAYMEDLKAGASPAKGRRQKAVKKGESISGFTINAIETEKVVLTRGEETLEVRVT